jgi:hypothetical protein
MMVHWSCANFLPNNGSFSLLQQERQRHTQKSRLCDERRRKEEFTAISDSDDKMAKMTPEKIALVLQDEPHEELHVIRHLLTPKSRFGNWNSKSRKKKFRDQKTNSKWEKNIFDTIKKDCRTRLFTCERPNATVSAAPTAEA